MWREGGGGEYWGEIKKETKEYMPPGVPFPYDQKWGPADPKAGRQRGGETEN